MHELALTESLVEAVDERVAPERVARVRLQVGRLAGVIPEALETSWQRLSDLFARPIPRHRGAAARRTPAARRKAR